MSECFELTRGCVLRATLLDSCGLPLGGPRSSVVTKCAAKVTVTPVISTRSDEVLRDDDNKGSIHIPAKSTTTRYTADLDLIGVNPDLITLLTGHPLVRNARGDVVGNDIITTLAPSNFALEIWTKLARPVSGNRYGWTLLPRLRGGRLTAPRFANAAVNFNVVGAHTVPSSLWGTGPYANGWDSTGWDMGPWDETPIQMVGPRTHWRVSLADHIPVPSCGAQALDVEGSIETPFE